MSRRPRILISLAVGSIAILALAFGARLLTGFDPFGEAMRAFDNRDYHEAVRLAQAYLKRRPGDRPATLMAARSFARLGFHRQAESCYQACGTLALDDLRDRAYGLARLGNPEAAAEIYHRILEREPHDLLSLKRLAATLIERERWKEARSISRSLIETPGGVVWGWTLAAIAAHESREAAEAAQAHERVIQLDPELREMPLPHKLFWNNFALDLLAIGQPDRTRAYLERALAEKPDPGLTELLGLTYEKEGRLDEAERCWRDALRLDPDHADTLIDLGRLSLLRRRWDDAIALLERAAELSPEAVEPVYGLGRAYRLKGDLQRARRLEERAARLRKAHPRMDGMGGMMGQEDPEGSAALGPDDRGGGR
jgi:tetratricopeptide (TPR) repeat protein